MDLFGAITWDEADVCQTRLCVDAATPSMRLAGVDSLQALLVALADRHQLGFDFARAFDCKTDRLRLVASHHASGAFDYCAREDAAGLC
jgi:hypothetical protein